MLTTPPLSLYVHLPWCVHKCPYCDFNSYALKSPLREAEYVDALLRDLDQDLPLVGGRRVETVFFGGGTPSLFRPEAVGRILEGVRARLPLAPDAEITLEANPGTVERGRFAGYRAAGVTRLSIGVQSFNNRHLQGLGRIHDADDARRAAGEAHAAGIDNFNLDLMYGLPGQDVEGAVRDLEQALALGPAHLSHYQLTIEAGTVFAGRPPQLPDEEAAEGMLATCGERLARAGFDRYEVSGYARPGRRSRHNLNYWRFGDYLGVGAGAHGKLTQARAREIWRSAQPREPRRYLAAAALGAGNRRKVPAADLPFEFMLNALRLVEGFERELFGERTGLPWESVRPTVQKLIARDLMVSRGSCYGASPLGLRFLNDVLTHFLPEPETAG